MKKIGLVVSFLFFSCIIFAQEFNATVLVDELLLPDGNVAKNVLFFKKWKDANKYLKSIQPKDKKVLSGSFSIKKAKTIDDYGNFTEIYDANDNETISNICKIMKDSDSVYAITGIDFGEIWTRCVFTYKSTNETLRYVRTDLFDTNNKIYVDFVANREAKEQKIKDAVGDATKSILESAMVVGASTTNSNTNYEDYKRKVDAYNAKTMQGVRRSEYNGIGSPVKTKTVEISKPNIEVSDDTASAALCAYFTKIYAEKNKNEGQGVLARALFQPTQDEISMYKSLILKGVSNDNAAFQVYNKYRAK